MQLDSPVFVRTTNEGFLAYHGYTCNSVSGKSIEMLILIQDEKLGSPRTEVIRHLKMFSELYP